MLEAAIQVFARKGYYGTTVDDIVAECGSSKGAFYFHFESKEALFLRLVEEFAGRLAGALEHAVRHAARGGPGRVEAAITAGLELMGRYPELTRLFLIEAVGINPQFEAKRRELMDRFAHVIRGYLEQAASRHPLAVGDTALASAAILGALNEVVVWWLSRPQERPLAELAPELTRFVLRAIGWQARA
ncbi:TetR/AcrR family transcriptional regulator [Geochorda subterranea]|uniref:TetR/AcrR family transcriptional regulator n=1 Tax=Geochorda subterranea TaxID=3109564 RepID=A0ABZ1BN75_9FIRM|nr:TetR/AcrR family transcriptional regulator [Limnochorda sp. LNt]WRP14261.1 TetR/AcrR family transcriptional regulator [Limnochorda sp. LNt]